MIFFIISVILLSFLFLAHKFEIQMLFFLTLGFLFIEGDYRFLIWFFIGMVIAVIISKGYYLKILKNHVGHLFITAPFCVKKRGYHQFRNKKVKKERFRKLSITALVTGILAFTPIFISTQLVDIIAKFLPSFMSNVLVFLFAFLGFAL